MEGEREATELELMQQAFMALWLICRRHNKCSDCPMSEGKGCAYSNLERYLKRSESILNGEVTK